MPASMHEPEEEKAVRGTTFAEELEPEEYRALERRIVRKQDLRLLPWLIGAYFLSYLDRVSLGNARTLNSDKPGESLVESLKLSGDRYTVVVAVFFIPYVLLEFPSGFLLKWMKPSVFLGRICITWGIVTMATAAVKSYGGLIAARIALGIAEAGFFPGCLILLTYWYKPDERATRMAIFASSVSCAGAFGGAISTGVSFLSGKGGLYGWQYLFLLEGAPSVILGFLLWFFMPDWPETARFLSVEERLFAVERLGEHAPKGTDENFSKKDFWGVLISWNFWAFAIVYFFLTNSLNATGLFLPSILQGMGYTGWRGQLLTVPPNVFGALVIILNSWHSDRTRERPRHILGAMALVALGYLLLAVLGKGNIGGRFVGVRLISCTNAAVIPFIAYRSRTVRGATATGIAISSMVAFANTAGAVAPFLFRSRDAPLYLPGIFTLFGMLGGAMAIMCVLWWRLGSSSEYETSEVEHDREGEADVEVERVQVVVEEKK